MNRRLVGNMILLVSNQTAQARRVNWKGRDWLVCPATLITGNGILPGSRGPLFYSNEELAKNPKTWDALPLTLGHPKDPLTNDMLTASSPGVLDRQGLGFTQGSQFRNGKLTTSCWFDVERTQKIANGIYRQLMQGRPVELSTGLYSDNEPAEPGAHYNGIFYTHKVRNMIGDHLAILDGEKGACGLREGCGVLVNKRDGHGSDDDEDEDEDQDDFDDDDDDDVRNALQLPGPVVRPRRARWLRRDDSRLLDVPRLRWY
jgi:hypothetical protein